MIKTEGKPSNKLKANTEKMSILKAMLICLPMLLLTALMTMGNMGPTVEFLRLAISVIIFIFMNTLFFLMVYTGKTSRYRAIFFVMVAVCFVASFSSHLLEVRGTTVLTDENIFGGETPFCHMVIPMVLIPAALTRTIIFPGSMLDGFAPIAGMLVIWMAAALALGRGWCSWVCFYGGFDEGFSKLCRKPLIKRIDRKWTLLSFAVLVAIVLTSAMAMSPTYCQWLCPFKTVTEYQPVTSLQSLLQAMVFVSLFIILVIVLPILSGKRTQCGLFCPFGAFQSFTNKLNIFDIRIDREKCINCKKCVRECPTLSIDEESLENGKALMTCTKCGRCVDICPTKAASYHIKGVGIQKSTAARLLFIYPAFLFAFIFGGSIITDGLVKIVKLVTTGSLI